MWWQFHNSPNSSQSSRAKTQRCVCARRTWSWQRNDVPTSRATAWLDSSFSWWPSSLREGKRRLKCSFDRKIHHWWKNRTSWNYWQTSSRCDLIRDWFYRKRQLFGGWVPKISWKLEWIQKILWYYWRYLDANHAFLRMPASCLTAKSFEQSLPAVRKKWRQPWMLTEKVHYFHGGNNSSSPSFQRRRKIHWSWF